MQQCEKELILDNITKYILNTCNISITKLLDNTREYIKYLLKLVRVNNNKLAYLKKQRDDLLLDLQILESTTVKGDSYSDSVCSFNNGMRVNTTELLGLKRAEIREKLQENVIDRNLLLQSLEKNNEVICNFIGLLKNENAQIVMQMTYIDCLSNSQIANTLLYSIVAIDKIRLRSINELQYVLTDYVKQKTASV